MATLRSAFEKLIPWRIGIGVIFCIIMLRLSGLSSSFEFLVFDRFLDILYQIKQEPESDRITLINLDRDFVAQLAPQTSQKDKPEVAISKLLQELLKYQPTVIGLDIVSARIPPTDEKNLVNLINQNENIITVEKLVEPEVYTLDGLSPRARKKQVSANDFPVDKGGTVRRVFLGVSNQRVNFRHSLSFKLAEIYLESQHNIESNNGLLDARTIRFNVKTDAPDIPDHQRATIVEIPRLHENSGAYGKEKGSDTDQESDLGEGSDTNKESQIYGLQTLLNFKRSKTAFPTVSAQDVIAGNFKPDALRDRILILSITDPSLAAYSSTPFDISQFSGVPSQAIGLELQAHATSQILAAVLDGRPLLRSFSTPVEYVLLISAGLLGMGLGQLSTSTARNLLGLGLTLALLLFLSLSSMYLWGWWLPIAPSFLVCSINGVAYIAYYQNERAWKRLTAKLNHALEQRDHMLAARNKAVTERDQALIQLNQALKDLKSERRATIEAATHEIHNGPLQTLALLIRRSQSPRFEMTQFQTELRQLDREIRDLSEGLTQAAMESSISLGLSNGERLDASLPLHGLLNSVFDIAINRDSPGLKSLKIILKNFDPCPRELSPELQRDIGHFLEEALCNVGKHAIQVTRLDAIGEVSGQHYCLTIRDNGAAAADHPLMLHKGIGTQQAEALAEQLGGQFKRQSRAPHGVTCQLCWPLTKSLIQAGIHHLTEARVDSPNSPLKDSCQS